MKSYFPRLLGNDKTKQRIGKAIEDGTLPHAFLIDGPRGSGKMTLALEIAAALNCIGGDALPCGVCNNCRRIYGGEFVDVKILCRQSDKATVGVGEIKDFRTDMFLSATESEYKIYIIKDAERMTPEAQNALLIVLEEPPRNVIIMLLASGTEKILSTIKSRAQYIAMSAFAIEELDRLLLKKSPEAARLKETNSDGYMGILIGSQGCIGRALSLLDPSEASLLDEERRTVMAVVSALGPRVPYSSVYSALSALPKGRVELMETLEGIITAIRDMIAVKSGGDVTLLFFTRYETAEECASSMSLRYLNKAYDLMISAHRECAKNANVSALIAGLGTKIKLL